MAPFVEWDLNCSLPSKQSQSAPGWGGSTSIQTKKRCSWNDTHFTTAQAADETAHWKDESPEFGRKEWALTWQMKKCSWKSTDGRRGAAFMVGLCAAAAL